MLSRAGAVGLIDNALGGVRPGFLHLLHSRPATYQNDRSRPQLYYDSQRGVALPCERRFLGHSSPPKEASLLVAAPSPLASSGKPRTSLVDGGTSSLGCTLWSRRAGP